MLRTETGNVCNVRKSWEPARWPSVLKKVNQGAVVKTAEAFKFGLVASFNRANCKVRPILPKHLDLVGFQIF